ncbi:HEPN domain-containing protein [Burkholderia ubonensis]|uniref:ApeA N-terminal domain 1-containing protein n=1 Tax=Burkholderia ubonensis TaxID=101571 RepID=UPI000A7DF595|nr:HEPN domain-containing protein [Burkholderia ubonensis]
MINDFTFNDNHIFSVEVSHGELGKIGAASLAFGPKHAISLNFKHGAFGKLEAGKKYDRLTAIEQDGKVFTLFNCELHFVAVYADYIVAGDTEGAFDLVEIEMSELTNWFFQFQRIAGDVGTSLEWKNRPSNVSADVTSPLGDFSLAITPHTELIEINDGSEIRDSAVLSIENFRRDFTLPGFRSIITGLCTLFSILLAQPVSIISVRVRSERKQGLSVYFPHYEKIEDADSRLDGRMRFLLKRHLFDENWQTIAQSFFNSDLRDPSWIRLSSMKRYRDFWEYKVAAYVFILDSYVDFKTKLLPKKINKSATYKIDTLKARLPTLHSILTQQQSDELVALATEIFGAKDHTFREKYQHVLSQVDENVIKIINLTDDNFTDLKRFRDDVAHGNPLNIDGALSSRMPQLTDKLSLLLTYFAFLDFGLNSQDFIECLSRTWNRIVMNSGINQLHLDRVNGSAEFIAVSAETLELFRQKIKMKSFCCFEIIPGAEPTFLEHHTDLYYKQLFAKKPKGASQDPNDFFQPVDKKVRTVGQLYFEHGDDHLQLNHVFLFE